MGDRLDEPLVIAGGVACAPPPGDEVVDSSAWNYANIWLPGIYFPCLP